METALFVVAKLVGLLIRVETWVLIGVMLTFVGVLRGHQRLARGACAVTLAGLLGLGFVPLYHPGLAWLEARHPPPDAARLTHVDGIVVLGGAEQREGSVYWNQPQLNSSAERIVVGAALALAYPQARLIHTGGSGSVIDLLAAAQGRRFVTEAQIAQAVYLSLGLPQERLVLESNARNTAQNARNALALARPVQGQTWLLVTSAAHMPRAMANFRDAGWGDIQPWPVDYRSSRFHQNLNWDLLNNIDLTNRTLHEGLGLLARAIRAWLASWGA